MGIVQASGSSGKLTSTAWIAGMDEMADETGLRCVVCDEGYINKPGELMGVYCYSRNTDLRCTVSAEQKVSDVAFNRLCLIKHISDSLASPRSLISMSSTNQRPPKQEWFPCHTVCICVLVSHPFLLY